MKYLKLNTAFICTIVAPLIAASPCYGQTKPVYHIYAGSTHAHTSLTQSHGAQLDETKGFTVHMSVDSEHVSHPANATLKPDADKYQGPPSVHFALAKTNGYDFYVSTDHSQEASFHPTRANNVNWISTHKDATAATDKNFVAIAGYEHSENDGPGGKGHFNVINSASYINALEPGVDVPYFYKWLDTVSAYGGTGAVVASFNHPAANAYDNWGHRDPKVTDIITMLEVINSNTTIHYEGFIKALDAGWKVSPVCGNDNHGIMGIATQKSRTFVLATAKTKVAILDAMKNRRTYASLDNNIQCRYTVNGEIMGSTLKNPTEFKFDIEINDPDTNNPKDKITRIDIVKDNGEVVQTYNPTPGYVVKWSPVIKDATNKYFFVRVWSTGGGDAPEAKLTPDKPMTWLAPVWTGR
ncbi:MAG: hypothetical protein V4592_01515 [Bacteroidota bacterium]